jgi:hypothetical protein
LTQLNFSALEIDGVGLTGAEPGKGKNSKERGEETRKKEEKGRRELAVQGVGFFWFLIL